LTLAATAPDTALPRRPALLGAAPAGVGSRDVEKTGAVGRAPDLPGAELARPTPRWGLSANLRRPAQAAARAIAPPCVGLEIVATGPPPAGA